jgi:hypothetical protein
MDEVIDFAKNTHRNLQEMVRLADAKATALMGATGVIVALLGGNLFEKVAARSGEGALLWLRGGTLILLLLAALCSILVLVPRFPGSEDVTPVLGAPGLMWALAKYYRNPAEYLGPLLEITPREVVADLAHESLKITWILKRKWKWLGRAALLLFGAFATWVATVIRILVGG